MSHETTCHCGNHFIPIWLDGLNTFSKVCPICSVKNLIRFVEQEEPDDTLADISSGEQAGARLREMLYGDTKL